MMEMNTALVFDLVLARGDLSRSDEKALALCSHQLFFLVESRSLNRLNFLHKLVLADAPNMR